MLLLKTLDIKSLKTESQYFITFTQNRIFEENVKRKWTMLYLDDKIMSDFNLYLEF